jgi:enoyl-CoA hydratase
MTIPTRVDVQQDGHVLMIGLNRPEKHNAMDMVMLEQLAVAYGRLDADSELRAGVLYAEGANFTAGMDLLDVPAKLAAEGEIDWLPEGSINPWQVAGRQVSKPIVAAAQGKCLTLGIELLLGADIAIAARSTRFAQLEVARGIFPFGGATLRLPQVAGWGNAMRWMLTAEEYDAEEALRIGLVQEVVDDGAHVDRALELARVIARQSPLGVQATLRSARRGQHEGFEAAERDLIPDVRALIRSEDARLGMEALITRKPPEFVGR